MTATTVVMLTLMIGLQVSDATPSDMLAELSAFYALQTNAGKIFVGSSKMETNKVGSLMTIALQSKFLSFSFTSGRTPRRRIAPQAIDRFKARVRELTRRTCGRSLSQVAKELSCYLIGWRGYFGFCETPSVLDKLDQWTRRRLRAIAWKQWKRGRTRFARLRRRGVGRDLAAQTAGSPHGPWRLGNSPALKIAMPNRYLGSLDLASVAAPRTT